MRVRFLFTGRWWATAFSVLAVAVPVAVVLTFTLGAYRTATAADRYTSAVGGDADVQLLQTGGRPVDAAVRALPGVLRPRQRPRSWPVRTCPASPARCSSPVPASARGNA